MAVSTTQRVGGEGGARPGEGVHGRANGSGLEVLRHPPQGWSRPIPGYRPLPRRAHGEARHDRDAGWTTRRGVADGQCGHRDSPETQPDNQRSKPQPCAPSPNATPSARSSRSSTRRPRRSSPSRFLSNAGIGVIDLDLPGAAPFILLSAMSLVIAAFVTTALADGRSGVRELRSRVFRFRVSPRWYVVAFVALPGAALAAAFVLAGAAPVVALASDPSIAISAVLGAVIAFALINWWEEAAWTGFALHRLQRRMGPVRASVVTTWMQAALHLPLVFIAGRRHQRSRRPGEHPVLPRRAVHPADPGPDDADLDLQRERSQRPDRRPVPRGPGRRGRGRVPAPDRAERRSGHGLRGLRGPRRDRPRGHPRPAGPPGRRHSPWSSARRWPSPREPQAQRSRAVLRDRPALSRQVQGANRCQEGRLVLLHGSVR